jgi:antitoxin component HigA of HigAB toxin-antitoxin module
MKKPISRTKKIIEDLQKDSKLKPQKVSESYIEMVEFFPLRPITAKKQYEAALQITEHLINALNEKKADEGLEVYLQTLTHLISAFEAKMFAAPEVSGREMLTYLMDLKGLNQTDVAKELGGQPNVSKILKGERELNIRQTKKMALRHKVRPALFF